MKLYQLLIQTHEFRPFYAQQHLYNAIELLDKNNPKAARKEVLEAFRVTEQIESEAKELSRLVRLLLEDVGDENPFAPPEKDLTPEEDARQLLFRLREKFEDIPY